PKTIKELGKTKKLILFVDGDRGGLLIAKDAIQHAQVAKIARAPDGKEVEELTEKEINVCLRNALSVEDFKKNYFKRRERKTQREEKASDYELVGVSKERTAMPSINFEQIVKKVEGTKACIIVFDSSGKKLVKKSMNELTKFLHRLRENRQKIYALVIDGTLTKGILNLAEQLSCQYIAARNFQATSEKIKFLSF
ncbi:MAG: hypothetical protein QXI41_00850, partial [Candidatus Pacearchaeota archaeon]